MNTVGELITELSKYPNDMEVILNVYGHVDTNNRSRKVTKIKMHFVDKKKDVIMIGENKTSNAYFRLRQGW